MVAKIKAYAKRMLRREWVFAILVALSFTLPIGTVTAARHATIAPLNILSGCCGWRWVPSSTPLNQVPSDVTDFVLPDRFAVKQSLTQGQIPLWNPSIFGGEVFMGNLQSVVFQPVNLLYFAGVNELNVQTVSVLASLFLLAMGMVLMLRELGRSRAASAIGALSFTGSCFAIFWAPFGMMVWMMAGVPFSIYWYLKWQKTGKGWWLGVLMLCLGMQLYFGHIQFSFAVYVILALFALYHFLCNTKRTKTDVKRLVITAVAMGIGLVLGSAQILPFLEQSAIGHRTGVVLTTSPTSLAGMKADLQNFVTPYTFNPISLQDYTNYGPYRFSIGLLSGILAIFGFVAAALRSRKHGYSLFFAGLLVIGALWMWGSLPQQALNLISNTFKELNPHYFIVIALFAAASLAAFGFDAVQGYITRHKAFLRKQQLLEALLYVLVTASLCFLIFYGFEILRNNQHITSIISLLATISALIITCTGPLLVRSRQLKRVIRGIALLLVLGNALMIFHVTQPLPSKALFYAGNPNFDFIRQDSGQTNLANVRMISPYSPEGNLYYGISTLNGYDSLYAKDTERFINAINYPEKTLALSSGPHGSHNAIYIGVPNKGALFENLGIQYVIAGRGVNLAGYSKSFVDPASQYVVYKADLPAPEVYFAHSTLTLSRNAQLQAIKENSLAYHTIAVESDTDKIPSGGIGTATYDFNVNKIHITAKTGKKNYLLIGQTYRKQWKAYLDGRPLKIIPADYNFMAVLVPAGQHKIELVYDPLSFKVGVGLTLTSLVGVLGFIAFSLYTEKYEVTKRKSAESQSL